LHEIAEIMLILGCTSFLHGISNKCLTADHKFSKFMKNWQNNIQGAEQELQVDNLSLDKSPSGK